MGIKDTLRRLLAEPATVKAPARPTRSAMTDELGGTGTENYRGYITEDYLADFHGEKGIKIYDEMRKSDATVKAVLRAMKLPILAAERMIEPTHQRDAQAVKIAEFVKTALFEKMDISFDCFLNEALGYLEFGFYYFEKVYKIEEGRVYLRKLASRPPAAHRLWIVESDESIPGVTQWLTAVQPKDENKSRSREIPMWKLVLFTNEKEGDNYEGVSVLRSAYKHWFYKNTMYRIDGIRLERGAGIPVITLPDGSSDTDMTKAETLGQNLKMNEQAYIVLPNDKWKFEMATAGIADQAGALAESVKHHDRMIVVNILAMFLDLGSGTTGSFALSKDQTDFFTLALRAIARYVSGVLNESVVKELVDMNFGPQEKYPKLRFGEIGEVDFSEMATAIKTLIDSGLVQVSPAMRMWAHKTFKLPEMSLEDAEKLDVEKPDMTKEKPATPEKQPTEEPADDEQLAEFKPNRELTFAERRVAFADIEESLDAQDEEVKKIIDEVTVKQKEDLLNKIEKAVDADDLEAVMALALIGAGGLALSLKERAKAALEGGKKDAAKEISVAVPETAPYVKRVVNSKIDLYIAARSESILTVIKASLLDWMNNDVGKTAILAQASEVFDALARQAASEMAGRVTTDAMNEGRAIVFEGSRPLLHGIQRSEVLDNKTCLTCQSIDGRTLAATDPFVKIGQIHGNCRGLWVAVLKTDAELPAIKALPKTIRNRFETIEGVPQTNAFDPLKKAIVRKGSRLEQAIEDGKVSAG